jgi:hypothetical protein
MPDIFPTLERFFPVRDLDGGNPGGEWNPCPSLFPCEGIRVMMHHSGICICDFKKRRGLVQKEMLKLVTRLKHVDVHR